MKIFWKGILRTLRYLRIGIVGERVLQENWYLTSPHARTKRILGMRPPSNIKIIVAELRQWKEVTRNGRIAYTGKLYNHISKKIPDDTDFVLSMVVSIIRYETYMIVTTEELDIRYGFKLFYDQEIRDK